MSDYNTEIWRPVNQYEGLYEVSNMGRVRSLDRITNYIDGRVRKFNGRMISPRKAGAGYYQVGLSNNGSKKRDYIHRLVAEAFIPNPKNLPEVNHLDGNKLNNRLSNLEWTTSSENKKHAYMMNLRGPVDVKGVKNGRAKIDEEDVIYIREQREKGVPRKPLAEKFGLNVSTITRITNRQLWKEV